MNTRFWLTIFYNFIIWNQSFRPFFEVRKTTNFRKIKSAEKSSKALSWVNRRFRTCNFSNLRKLFVQFRAVFETLKSSFLSKLIKILFRFYKLRFFFRTKLKKQTSFLNILNVRIRQILISKLAIMFFKLQVASIL